MERRNPCYDCLKPDVFSASSLCRCYHGSAPPAYSLPLSPWISLQCTFFVLPPSPVTCLRTQPPRLAEHTARGQEGAPKTTRATCWNNPRTYMRPKSPSSSPAHHLSGRNRRRWRASESLSFVFQGVQEISGWSSLHYSAGLNLNQIGHLISLFSHLLAYKHSGEKN